MKLSLIKTGAVFVFGDDTTYPFLKVDTGFCDIIEDRFWPMQEDTDAAIPVDRSHLWKLGMKNEIQQFVIEERIAKAIADHAFKEAPAESYVGREIFFFTCSSCKRRRRVTLDEEKAGKMLCRKCRKAQPDPNQATLFPEVKQ